MQSAHVRAVPRLLLGISLALVLAAGLPAVVSAAVTGVFNPSFSSGPSNGSYASSKSPSFEFSSSTTGATYMCQLDTAAAAACTSPKSYSALAEGKHAFKVYATKTGLSNSGTVEVSWTIDATPPAAPTLALDRTPFLNADNNYTSSNSFTVAYSGESGATFRCFLATPTNNAPVNGQNNDSNYSACGSSPLTTPMGSDGEYFLCIHQVDAAGNVSLYPNNSSRAGCVFLTRDTVAPDKPTIAALTSSGAFQSGYVTKDVSGLQIWSGIFGSVPSDGVAYSVDGAAYTALPSQTTRLNSTYVLTSLSDGTHTISFKWRDLTGNWSEESSISFTIDTTGPAAPTILDGIPGATNANFTYRFSFAEPIGKRDNEQGNLKAQCQVDSGTWGYCYTSASAKNDFQVGATSGSAFVWNLAEGTHTVSVRQVDTAGNVGVAVTSKTFTVDRTAPQPPVLSGVPTGTSSGPSSQISIAGESGASFTCSFDFATYTDCSSPQSLAGFAPGSHTLRVKQTDSAGNTSDMAFAAWTYADTTAPVTPGPFTGVPVDLTLLTSATIGFTLGESGGTVECRIDSGSWVACTSVSGTSGSFAVSGLSIGSHTISVRQTDFSGNVSAAGTATWTVAAPITAMSILTPAAGTKTVYKAGGTWHIKTGLLFSNNGDPRGGAQPLTVQVAVSSLGKPVKGKPSNAQPLPTPATFKQGVVAWHVSGEVTRTSMAAPVWVRVGNKAGKWTGWVKLTA